MRSITAGVTDTKTNRISGALHEKAHLFLLRVRGIFFDGRRKELKWNGKKGHFAVKCPLFYSFFDDLGRKMRLIFLLELGIFSFAPEGELHRVFFAVAANL